MPQNTTPVTPSTILTGQHSVLVVGGHQLASSKWTLHKMNAAATLNNARDGILRLPTLSDAAGTVSLFYELGTPPESVLDVGDIVSNAQFFLDYTQNAYYQMNIIVTAIDIDTGGVEGHGIDAVVHWALQSGQVTPVNT